MQPTEIPVLLLATSVHACLGGPNLILFIRIDKIKFYCVMICPPIRMPIPFHSCECSENTVTGLSPKSTLDG